MFSNFPASLNFILASEGGFSNHPLDPGGMTNLGVTKKAWEAYVGREVNETEMRALTIEIVSPFYKKNYWDSCKCDDLPRGIDYLVFDFAVNAGPRASIKILQKALWIPEDGLIGRITISAATEYPANELIELFSLAKEAYYKSLYTFSTFGKGWLNRVAAVQKNADAMIAAEITPTSRG